MPEIGSSGLMSGDGKRGVGHRPQATAPILDSTRADSDYASGALARFKVDGGIFSRRSNLETIGTNVSRYFGSPRVVELVPSAP